MVDGDVSAHPTLVGALCEAAYSLAMQGDKQRSIRFSEQAISVARKFRTDDALLARILREHYVAGEFITPPLAAAFLTACDVRINLADEWDPDGELANEFYVYWNLLNDECGGLSALQVPYLIAILSDTRWMAQRPDLAAPIARALYLRTSASIPQALWRKANLFAGGFRFSETVNNIPQYNFRAGCALLILALAGYGGAEAIVSTLEEVPSLSPNEIANFFGIENTDVPSGTEIVEGLELEDSQGRELSDVSEVLIGELSMYESLPDALEIATGSSSSVAAHLI
jgi:hypothetical protein